MDQDTQKYFDMVVAKDVNDLKPHDIAFLKARYQYLDRHNRKKLDPILKMPTPVVEPEVVEETDMRHPGDIQEEEGQVEDDSQAEDMTV